MIDRTKRKAFADILDKFADSSANREDWFNYIIEHYVDEGLENIRREVVRLRIKAGDLGFVAKVTFSADFCNKFKNI